MEDGNMEIETEVEEDLDIETEGYGRIHKLVLQGIMSAGFLDVKGVKKLYVGACHRLNLNSDLDNPDRPWLDTVQKIVKIINERIKNFDMAIRSATCELTGKKFYIFLVTVEKPIMKLQTTFSKGELELFQKIMTGVLRTYDSFTVPHTDCLNMAREIDTRSLNMEMAEAFIQRMINYHYLAKMPNESQEKGRDKETDFEVTLGVRTIREFEPILRDVYDEVMTNCNLCKTIMLHGYKCPTCDICVHRSCYEKYQKKLQNTLCPGCKGGWNNKSMVKRMRHMGVGSPGRGRRSGHAPTSQSGDDDEIEMPDLQPMVLSPTRRGKRGKRKSASPSPQTSPLRKNPARMATPTSARATRSIRRISSGEESD